MPFLGPGLGAALCRQPSCWLTRSSRSASEPKRVFPNRGQAESSFSRESRSGMGCKERHVMGKKAPCSGALPQLLSLTQPRSRAALQALHGITRSQVCEPSSCTDRPRLTPGAPQRLSAAHERILRSKKASVVHRETPVCLLSLTCQLSWMPSTARAHEQGTPGLTLRQPPPQHQALRCRMRAGGRVGAGLQLGSGYSLGGSEEKTAERRALAVPAQQLSPQKARGTVREPSGSPGASGWLRAARRAGQRRAALGTAAAPPRPRLMRKDRPGRRRGGVAGMAQRTLPLPRQQSFSPPVVPNPFVHPGRPSAGDKLRLVLLGIILLPLRAICMVILLLLSWLSASAATFRHTGGASVPLKGWRRRMIQATLSRLTRTLFFVMGFRVKVKGKVASLQEAPIFVAAPHSSFFDAIVSALTGMPSIVSRAENLSTPIFGTILSSLQPVAVSRQDPDSRKNTVSEITNRALSRGQWPQILIFPEGTCTNRSCLITFKQGAFIPGVPVQPVLLRYPNKLDTVTWTWQGYSLKELCIMTLCQLFTKVEVEFLPVYVPTEEERNDPVLFANRVRQTMATALKVPVTDHTFEDCRLMISAGQLTLPMEAGLVEFTKISKKLNLKWNHVREQLDTFAAIASASKGGRIGIEEFAEYLKLPISDVLRELFLLFDRNGDGTIDFREYVIGLSILCNPANTEETIHMAFKLFDQDDDGTITEKEFACIIQSALGLPDLDVSNLFKEIDADETGKLSYDEFKNFALEHPEYAKLFTTYLELQRHQVGMAEEDDDIQPSEAKHTPIRKSAVLDSETRPTARNKVCPADYEEDNSSTSDKKDD